MKKIKLKVLKLVAMVIALLFVISCGAMKVKKRVWYLQLQALILMKLITKWH